MARPSLRHRLAQSLARAAVRFGNPKLRNTPFRVAALIGQTQSSGYDGVARRSRRTRGYTPGQGSPATDQLTDLPELRGRSRDLSRNVPLATGAINTVTGGVVGAGLVLKPAPDAQALGIEREAALEKSQQLAAEFDIWANQADWQGILHFADMQALILRSVLESGDIGIVRRYERRPGSAYGLRLALVEADRISNPNRARDTKNIMGGVQFSNDGVVEGYHFTSRHPGDRWVAAPEWRYAPRTGSSGQLLFLLPYGHLRPGQARGVPYFAPILEIVKQMGMYMTAEASAAVNAAMLFAFVESEKPVDVDGNPLIGEADTDLTDSADEVELKDGAFITMNPGEKVSIPQHGRPNAEFDPFMMSVLKQIGVALDQPLEVLTKHFSASYSASRAAVEMAYQFYRQRRAWTVRQVNAPIYEWQVTEAVAAGRLELDGFLDDPAKRRAWLRAEWIGPPRMQIDPVKEANAAKIEIETGLTSRDAAIAARGGTGFEPVNEQLAHESEARRSHAAASAAIADEQPSETGDREDRA